MPTVRLAPIFNEAQFNNGIPLNGGKVGIVLAGASPTSYVTVYTDSTGNVIGTNPVILNSRGEPTAPIWLKTSHTYDIYLYDSLDNQLRVLEDVTGINDTSVVSFNEWVLYGSVATYISASSFSVTGDQRSVLTIGRRIRATVSGSTKYGTILTSVFAFSITTVTVQLDSGVLDSSLFIIYYGFIDPTLPSTPYIANSVNTALAGDIRKIINGDFSIWQRDISQTSNGYGSDDRWVNGNVGSTKTHSQQLFNLGNASARGSRYFSQTVVASVAGAANYVLKHQRIQRVATFENKTITLSFDAAADATKNIAIEFIQSFGTGGSPSANVAAIGAQKVALATGFQRFNITVDIPSISGKTLGTNGDDYLGVFFWFDAGSSFNSRTDTLGQQSGTFKIANVQITEDFQALPFESRLPGLELMLCQRYYWRGLPAEAVNFPAYAASSVMAFIVSFPVQMRTVPTLGSSLSGSTLVNISAVAFENQTVNGAKYKLTSTGINPNSSVTFGASDYFEADAEL